jgi:malonyl-CoA/methylmalonyl-CoA synthetase
VLAELPRCTVLMGVPTHYTRLLEDERFDRDACAHVRLFVSGSAPMLASTHEAFRDRTGHAVLERYGMTETSMLTSNPLAGERRAGTVGFPLPGTDVRIADDEVIEVRGPNVFAGYWRRPELRATEFTDDGWFRTGDVGAWDDDGYLRIVGRAKDLVISGGLNVYPKEVEDVVDSLPGVVESAVIGVPDPDLGEAVVAVVVGDVDPAAVRAAARERLAGFKVPKRVEVVAELPRNAMGKVQKNVLRQRFGA